jgi:hypothetical protein
MTNTRLTFTRSSKLPNILIYMSFVGVYISKRKQGTTSAAEVSLGGVYILRTSTHVLLPQPAIDRKTE